MRVAQTMRHCISIAASLCVIFLLEGCSTQLSRRQAARMINAKVEPHVVKGQKDKVVESVPGFALPDDDRSSGAYFTLDNHKEYGPLTSSKRIVSPDSETYLLGALSKLGYVTVEEDGPKTVSSYGIPLSYNTSRTVKLTAKVGTEDNRGYQKLYSSGFDCYPPPDYQQCSLPEFITVPRTYTITGIVQDQSKAQVNVLIDWEMTPFAKDLKPYAAQVKEAEKQYGDESSYDRYSAIYSWAHYLNDHSVKGSSPARVLFQKFDDGWRIVDQEGHSEGDYHK